MKRAAHQRWLDYNELCGYFLSPSDERLVREDWEVLDAELERLESLDKLEGDEQRLLRGLRKRLLRD